MGLPCQTGVEARTTRLSWPWATLGQAQGLLWSIHRIGISFLHFSSLLNFSYSVAPWPPFSQFPGQNTGFPSDSEVHNQPALQSELGHKREGAVRTHPRVHHSSSLDSPLQSGDSGISSSHFQVWSVGETGLKGMCVRSVWTRAGSGSLLFFSLRYFKKHFRAFESTWELLSHILSNMYLSRPHSLLPRPANPTARIWGSWLLCAVCSSYVCTVSTNVMQHRFVVLKLYMAMAS